MCNRESFQTQAIGLWRRTLRRPQNLSPTSSNVAMRRAPLSASPKAANSRQGLYEKNDTVIVNQRRENAHSITGCHDLHCTFYATSHAAVAQIAKSGYTLPLSLAIEATTEAIRSCE